MPSAHNVTLIPFVGVVFNDRSFRVIRLWKHLHSVEANEFRSPMARFQKHFSDEMMPFEAEGIFRPSEIFFLYRQWSRPVRHLRI